MQHPSTINRGIRILLLQQPYASDKHEALALQDTGMLGSAAVRLVKTCVVLHSSSEHILSRKPIVQRASVAAFWHESRLLIVQVNSCAGVLQCEQQ